MVLNKTLLLFRSKPKMLKEEKNLPKVKSYTQKTTWETCVFRATRSVVVYARSKHFPLPPFHARYWHCTSFVVVAGVSTLEKKIGTNLVALKTITVVKPIAHTSEQQLKIGWLFWR